MSQLIHCMQFKYTSTTVSSPYISCFSFSDILNICLYYAIGGEIYFPLLVNTNTFPLLGTFRIYMASRVRQ